jgi:cation:H+ antiporter
VVDNIVGSNIANALLILGIGGIVAKGLKANISLINTELPFFFMSMALFGYFSIDKHISRGEGFVLLMFLIIFGAYQIFQKSGPHISQEKKKKRSKKYIFRLLFITAISAVVLAFSAKYLVTSVLTLSDLLGISSSLLTITVVALGTSLPEIITSISAIKRGNHEIAIGNVLGSNTFNLLLIGGLPAIIHPLSISMETFTIGLPFLVIATFIAFFALYDDKVNPWEGLAMIFFYFVFILKIIHFL